VIQKEYGGVDTGEDGGDHKHNEGPVCLLLELLVVDDQHDPDGLSKEEGEHEHDGEGSDPGLFKRLNKRYLMVSI
jgi:hypothetical protein